MSEELPQPPESRAARETVAFEENTMNIGANLQGAEAGIDQLT